MMRFGSWRLRIETSARSNEDRVDSVGCDRRLVRVWHHSLPGRSRRPKRTRLRLLGDHEISSEISGLGVVWHLRGHEVRYGDRLRADDAVAGPLGASAWSDGATV